MSKRRATPGESTPSEVAQLSRDLAARERQLRDLTEQSLGFLEELAESRRLNGAREELVSRLADLERALADAKSRLRHAGGAAPAPALAVDAPGDGATTRPALEIVFWGSTSRAAARAASEMAGSPVSWIGMPDAVPADETASNVSTISHRDARTPAQCWNLGMASTTADAVLFVGPGVAVPAPPELPDGLPANAALLCPRIERGDSADVGCDQVDELMRLRPHPASGDDEPFFRVQWADAAAFVVRRAAFDRVGTFDEGLLGAAALLEFGLRARRANFDVLGVGGVTVTATAADVDAADLAGDRERLVVVAMHRPDRIGEALATTPVLWELPAPEVPGFLAQLLARLPTVDGLPHQRAVLERIASGLVQRALPVAHVASLVRRARLSLSNRFAAAGTIAGRDAFVDAAARAEAQRVDDAESALDALSHEIVMCADAAAATAQALDEARRQMRELDEHRHAQSDRAERAEGARQHTQQQLDQVQTWLREAQQELRDKHAEAATAARGNTEAKQQLQDLEARRSEAQRRVDELSDLPNLHRELERKHAELDRAHTMLETQHRELEREYLAADADSRALREQLSRAKSLVGVVTETGSDDLQTRLRHLHEQAQELASALHASGAADAEDLVMRVDDLSQRLAASEMLVRDRERWIALLLREIGHRRLFPRALQDHERALVERVGRTP